MCTRLLPRTSNSMKITYDKKADAMYLYFQKGKKVARTVELADVLLADLDGKGKVIGIEVLCASHQVRNSRGVKSRLAFPSMNVPVEVLV